MVTGTPQADILDPSMVKGTAMRTEKAQKLKSYPKGITVSEADTNLMLALRALKLIPEAPTKGERLP